MLEVLIGDGNRRFRLRLSHIRALVHYKVAVISDTSSGREHVLSVKDPAYCGGNTAEVQVTVKEDRALNIRLGADVSGSWIITPTRY